MNPLILWAGLFLLGGFIYLFFRARWWLYLSVLGLDMMLMGALGLDKITQFIAGALMLLGFAAFDLLVIRLRKSSARDSEQGAD